MVFVWWPGANFEAPFVLLCAKAGEAASSAAAVRTIALFMNGTSFSWREDNSAVRRTFRAFHGARQGTKRRARASKKMAKIDILDKPIARIQETCDLMGIADQFDRALPELETFLEEEVANGETSETRLTYDGLCHLRHILRHPGG